MKFILIVTSVIFLNSGVFAANLQFFDDCAAERSALNQCLGGNDCRWTVADSDTVRECRNDHHSCYDGKHTTVKQITTLVNSCTGETKVQTNVISGECGC